MALNGAAHGIDLGGLRVDFGLADDGRTSYAE